MAHSTVDTIHVDGFEQIQSRGIFMIGAHDLLQQLDPTRGVEFYLSGLDQGHDRPVARGTE